MIRVCSAEAANSDSGGSEVSPSNKRRRSGNGANLDFATSRQQNAPQRPRSTSTAAAGSGGRAPRSHVQTEQRRRDRINDGFNLLRELIPNKEKLDKAAFLMSTMDYIRQLQAVLQQLLEMGVVGSLPEDLQWTIRMLLPKPTPGLCSAQSVPAANQVAPPQRPMALPLQLTNTSGGHSLPASCSTASPANSPSTILQPSQRMGLSKLASVKAHPVGSTNGGHGFMPVVPPLPAPPVLPPSDGPPNQAAVAAYMQYLLTLSPQQVSMLATQLAPQTAQQIQPAAQEPPPNWAAAFQHLQPPSQQAQGAVGPLQMAAQAEALAQAMPPWWQHLQANQQQPQQQQQQQQQQAQNGPSCSGTNVAAMNNAWQLAQLAQHATQHQHPGA